MIISNEKNSRGDVHCLTHEVNGFRIKAPRPIKSHGVGVCIYN